MTIKQKLTLNITVGLLTVCCVAAAGVLGMGQVRKRLTELTERSTPFQVRTTESRRAAQQAIGELDRLSRSPSRGEYNQAGQAARLALQEADSAARALSELSGGGRDDGLEELRALARQIFQVSNLRLVSDSAAGVAGRQISAQFLELDRHIDALDQRVRQLQATQQATFSSASGEVERSMRQLHAVDQLKGLLLELQVAVLDLQAVQSKSAVTIARARINSQIGKINQSEVLGTDRSISAGTVAYIEAVSALVAAKQAALADESGAAGAGNLGEINAGLKEKFAVVQLAITEAGTSAAQRSSQEQERQGSVVQQATLASSVLLQASELVALGLAIQAEAARLTTARDGREVDSLETRLAADFSRGGERSRSLAGLLAKLDARAERRLLESARNLLEASRERLFAPDGVVALIRRQLEMGSQADQASERLRQLVARQAAQGRETMSSARGEQERAIGTVNRMVRISLVAILAISGAALVFGVLFGSWIYRSIARSLGQVQRTIAEVEASSDLSLRVPGDGGDEVGQMALAFNALLETQQRALGEVGRVMAALAEGDFSPRVDAVLKGDLAHLQQSVNSSADRIQLVLGDVLGVVAGLARGDLASRVGADSRGELGELKEKLNLSLDALAGTLRRLHEQAEQTSGVARETRAAVGQISADVHQQTRHIGEVGEKVVLAAAGSRTIAERTAGAAAVSRNSVERVEAGQRRMEQAVGLVREVAESSEQIRGISGTIRRLAAQTRLLSLNATIEAARAGEAGRGFAVVAHEVGQLADSSSASSEEIGRLVEVAAARVESAVQAVLEVSRDLDEIRHGSEEADEALGQVAGALALQLDSIQGIELRMDGLRAIAESNAGSAEEISATMSVLADQAAATKREVEAFRLA